MLNGANPLVVVTLQEEERGQQQELRKPGKMLAASFRRVAVQAAQTQTKVGSATTLQSLRHRAVAPPALGGNTMGFWRSFSALSDDVVKGRVKWFDNKKGFGFIVPSGNAKDESDVFVHYSSISQEQNEFRTLEEDEEVEFSVLDDHQSGRRQATHVRRLNPPVSDGYNDF